MKMKIWVLLVACLVAGCATNKPSRPDCGADHTPRDAQMGKCERLVVVPAL
jgi:hypothetical protein